MVEKYFILHLSKDNLICKITFRFTLIKNSLFINYCDILVFLSSLVPQTVKNLPAIQEFQIQSLGWEGLLQKGMATHSSILAWRIPWTEEPGRLQSMEQQRVRRDWTTNTHTYSGCHLSGFTIITVLHY